MSDSNVAEFYNERHVFVTGATGFMGKVLIEKLLRSCPNISTIYMLMRPKKNKDVPTRLEQMLSCQAFDNLRLNNSDALKKLVAFEGDMEMPGLGLSSLNTETLIEKVSVTFHVAASIRFVEPLKRAIQLNLLGTSRVVELCKKMKNLSALVHVSTAFSNCYKNEIREEIYPPFCDYRQIIQLAEILDDASLDLLTKSLIEPHPNTYTFTKSLAEQVLLEEANNIPISVVRPSIVCSSFREPIKGWIDSTNGPTSAIIATGKGLLRVMHANPAKRNDIIPVDTAVNLCIVAAWHRTTKKLGHINIFNIVSGPTKYLTWGEFSSQIQVTARHNVIFDKPIRFPSVSLVPYSKVVTFIAFFEHWIPAYVIDTISKIIGKKPALMKIVGRMHTMCQSLAYFGNCEWEFSDDNVQKLWQSLPESDQRAFNFSLEDLNWNNYLEAYVLGIKTFILKEKTTSEIFDRRNMKRLWLIKQVLRFLPFAIFYIILIRMSDNFRKMNKNGIFRLIRMITSLPFIKNV